MERIKKDLVIIGSGPAGLSAAVYGKRAKFDEVVLEKEMYSGGQIVTTERVDNYLGLYGVSGYDLAMKFKEHVDRLSVPFLEAGAEKITDLGAVKEIELDNGDVIETKAIILASGASHKKLGVKGEEELCGAGVSYCATCDGAFFTGKTVAVAGGGDVALEDALYLSKGCKKVYLIHRRDGFRAAKVLQDEVLHTENIEFLPFHEIEEICGSGSVEALVIKNNQTNETKELAVSGVFIAIGMEPQSDLLSGIASLDERGYVIAGEDCRSSAAGIYAAGDVRTKPLRQVVTAVADGASAVASIERDLVQGL